MSNTKTPKTFGQFVEQRMPGCDEAQLLIAKKAWDAGIGLHAEALASLQRLDFRLRAAGGEGLPAEACKIIDGALA